MGDGEMSCFSGHRPFSLSLIGSAQYRYTLCYSSPISSIAGNFYLQCVAMRWIFAHKGFDVIGAIGSTIAMGSQDTLLGPY